jgi:hypothetical protein
MKTAQAVTNRIHLAEKWKYEAKKASKTISDLLALRPILLLDPALFFPYTLAIKTLPLVKEYYLWIISYPSLTRYFI